MSISAKRVVTMPTTIQPGVNTFKVTTANKRGSGFQLAQAAAGYTAADAARDIEKGLDGGNVKAIKRFEANVTLLGGMTVNKDKAGKLVVDLDPGDYWALDTNTNDPEKFFAFTVAGVDTGNVMPEADATLKAVQDTTWANKPESIPNKGLLTFKNAASQNHFIEMAKLKKGKTYKDFKKWFAAAMTAPRSAARQLRRQPGQRSREPGPLGDLQVQPAQGQLRDALLLARRVHGRHAARVHGHAPPHHLEVATDIRLPRRLRSAGEFARTRPVRTAPVSRFLGTSVALAGHERRGPNGLCR